MKKIISLVSILATSSALSVTITYNVENPSGLGSEFALLSGGGDPLPVGSLIEFGYFTGDTTAFEGEWTSLGDAAIGDGGQAAGHFRTAFSVDFDSAPGNQLDAGTRLGLRFYDGSDNSGAFNTVANLASGGDVPAGSSEWTWSIDQSSKPDVSPAASTLVLTNSSFDAPSEQLVWETGTAFAVPEPSVLPLALLSCIGLFSRKRR